MGKSSKSCFDVYGYENADALVYDTSTQKIIGGTLNANTSWGYWNNLPDGITRMANIRLHNRHMPDKHQQINTLFIRVPNGPLDRRKDISDGDNMCHKCPSSNVVSCNQDTVKCKKRLLLHQITHHQQNKKIPQSGDFLFLHNKVH